MAGTLKRLAGPVTLGNSVADIFNASSALIYTNVRCIRVVNKTAGAVTFTMYLGATSGVAAGTEIAVAESVPANDHVDLPFSPGLKMVSSDFLTGLASAATSLVVIVMGEQHVV